MAPYISQMLKVVGFPFHIEGIASPFAFSEPSYLWLLEDVFWQVALVQSTVAWAALVRVYASKLAIFGKSLDSMYITSLEYICMKMCHCV